MDRNSPRGAPDEIMRLRPCVADCLYRMTRTPWLRSCRLSSNSSKLTTQFPRLCVSPKILAVRESLKSSWRTGSSRRCRFRPSRRETMSRWR